MNAKYWLLGALAVSGMGMGDAAAQVTAADYERAAKMLGDRTAPLVDGGVRGVTWLDDGSVVLLDVRPEDEFALGHLPGALNIPLGELRASGTALLDARLPAGTREVVLVCQSGMRSRVAQAILSGDPARTYLNLAGGMAAWQSHGLPIVRHD